MVDGPTRGTMVPELAQPEQGDERRPLRPPFDPEAYKEKNRAIEAALYPSERRRPSSRRDKWSQAPRTRLEEKFERPPRNPLISFISGRCYGAGTPPRETGFEGAASAGTEGTTAVGATPTESFFRPA